MYLLSKSRGLRLAAHESLAAIFALSVAETFYRFHVFTLECLAFLATWYGVSWALNNARKFGHQTYVPRHVRLLRHHEQVGPELLLRVSDKAFARGSQRLAGFIAVS